MMLRSIPASPARRTFVIPCLLLVAHLAGCASDDADGQSQTPIDADLRTASIVGSIQPAESGIGVIATRNGMETGITLTDDDGRYRLDDLLPGEYGLIVSGLGFFTDTSVRGLTVERGEEAVAPDVRMRPLDAAATLFGEVADARSLAALEDVQVAIRCRSGICPNLSVLTDADGRFEVDIWPDLDTEVVFTRIGYGSGSACVDGQSPGTRFAVPRVLLEPVAP